MIDQRTFPNDASSVPAARRYVAQALGDVESSVADAVALMVSELSANAVRHTATHFTLSFERTGSRLRIAVSDSGPGQPVVRSPEPTEPSGRGLQIVEALADEWGIIPAPEGEGKTVWFALDLADDAAADVAHRGESELESTGSSSGPGAPTMIHQVRTDRRPQARALSMR